MSSDKGFPIENTWSDDTSTVKLYIHPDQLTSYIEVDERKGWPNGDTIRLALERAASYGYFPQDPTGEDKSTSEFVGSGDTFRVRYYLTPSLFGYEHEDDEPERAFLGLAGKGDDDGLAGVA